MEPTCRPRSCPTARCTTRPGDLVDADRGSQESYTSEEVDATFTQAVPDFIECFEHAPRGSGGGTDRCSPARAGLRVRRGLGGVGLRVRGPLGSPR